MEVKARRARPRKDQAGQQRFLQENGVPVVRTVEEALVAVGALNELPRSFGDGREAVF
jgi:hypothetical protein